MGLAAVSEALHAALSRRKAVTRIAHFALIGGQSITFSKIREINLARVSASVGLPKLKVGRSRFTPQLAGGYRRPYRHHAKHIEHFLLL
jgi:hypothetical protein